MASTRFSVWASGLLALALAVMGCGGGGSDRAAPSAIVEGTITMNGTGVAKGTVNFWQKDTGFAAAAEINNGAFKFADKLPTGNFAVYVTAPSITVAPEPDKPAPKVEDAKDIPALYREQGSSPLTADLKSGSNAVKLELTP